MNEDAQKWLEDMIVNMAQSEATPNRDMVEEHIDEFARQSTWPDRARVTLIQTINQQGGLYIFISPDDDQPCISTARHLQQMLQAPTMSMALDEVNARMLF